MYAICINLNILQISLSFGFRMGRSTVCGIVRETCDVLWQLLAEEYVSAPSSAAEWEGVSKEFYLRWNFPHWRNDDQSSSMCPISRSSSNR